MQLQQGLPNELGFVVAVLSSLEAVIEKIKLRCSDTQRHRSFAMTRAEVVISDLPYQPAIHWGAGWQGKHEMDESFNIGVKTFILSRTTCSDK